MRLRKGFHTDAISPPSWRREIYPNFAFVSQIANHHISTLEGHMQEVCGLKWCTDGQCTRDDFHETILGDTGYFVFSGYDLTSNHDAFEYNNVTKFGNNLRTKIPETRRAMKNEGKFTMVVPIAASCHQYTSTMCPCTATGAAQHARLTTVGARGNARELSVRDMPRIWVLTCCITNPHHNCAVAVHLRTTAPRAPPVRRAELWEFAGDSLSCWGLPGLPRMRPLIEFTGGCWELLGTACD